MARKLKATTLPAKAVCLVFILSAYFVHQVHAEAPLTDSQRIPWTTSRIQGSPEPPLPYVTERAFPALKFDRCLDLAMPPGSRRLFVAEQSGKIFSFRNTPDVARAELVIDLAKQVPGVQNVYALTFHPKFEENRFCYVCYVKAANLPHGTHVSRFQVSRSDPPTIDVTSEKTIITWLSGGHNGCCLKFGPDGYLYVSTGDGVGPNPPDTKRTGQDISDLLSSILRIDVDRADGDKNYRIPDDNPFVQMPKTRGEIWAYGLRNPWRMSFDGKTGDLWVGDVGWELWELLHRIQRGGNYGWGVTEGRQSINPEWSRGPTPILPPTIDHPHSESSSITEGLTYYGVRMKELLGVHLYGDYDTGKIWGFRWDGGKIIDHRELADTTHRIVGFGEDHRGECYLLDHTAGTLHRLIPNPAKARQDTFPRKLSNSGLFASLPEMRPAPGVLPYSINAEPWSDHAVTHRFVAVPQALSIKAEGAQWQFPQDSVLVKTMSLDLERENTASRRRIETQILHFDGEQWQPYTYRWNDEQTDAILLNAAGAEQTFAVKDPTAPGGIRQQTWRFAGCAECQRCHNRWSGPVLGFNTIQLNKDLGEAEKRAAQLERFSRMHLFEKPLHADEHGKLADPRDRDAACDARARAYLHVNCAHCHRKHAGGSVVAQMQHELPLNKTQMVGVRPSQGAFGIRGAQVIASGDPYRSVLWYRMSKLGGGRMPHIGSAETDVEGVRLIHQWLTQLPTNDTAAGAKTIPSIRRKQSEDLKLLISTEAADVRERLLRRLLSSTSGAMLLLHSLNNDRVPASVRTAVIAMATEHDDIRVRDLYERFVPANRRAKRLGSVIRPEQILALKGDAVRGKDVFSRTAGVQCLSCHRVQGKGKELGPELTMIGKKYDRPQLLESILNPSKSVDPKYVTYAIETVDGRLLSGLLVEKNEQEVTLKDTQNQLVRVPAKQIEQLVAQRMSLMPELLVRDLTAQQVADLLAYLAALK